MSLIDH